MKKIVVIGSYNVGLTICAKTIPRPAQTVMGDSFEMGPGGKGSNQAITISRLGGAITFIAKIGADSFGKDALALFKEEGIDTSNLFIDEYTHTGVGMVFLDEAKQNAIGVAPGANYNLSPSDIASKESIINEADILLMQLENPIETVYAAIEMASSKGKFVVLNPAPAFKIDEKYYPLIDVITPNEVEASEILDIKVETVEDGFEAGKRLLDKGVKNAVITLGSRGAVLVNKEVKKHIKPYKVSVSDSTGAGDAFNGGLVYALSRGDSLEDALIVASKVAAISVMSVGTVKGLPTIEQVENFNG